MGRHKIARWLDHQGVSTWGVAPRAAYWRRSYVQKILINPVVIGTFVPHHKEAPRRQCKRQRKAFDPIPNYFPAVVDRETFDSIASGVSTPVPRGRHANREIRSLFGGVLRCPQCGATVSRAIKGGTSASCARVNSLGLAARTHPDQPVRYEGRERLFRQWAKGITCERAPSRYECSQFLAFLLHFLFGLLQLPAHRVASNGDKFVDRLAYPSSTHVNVHAALPYLLFQVFIAASRRARDRSCCGSCGPAAVIRGRWGLPRTCETAQPRFRTSDGR
jgi:hypothetical protein